VKGVTLIHDLVRTGEKVIPIDSTVEERRRVDNCNCNYAQRHQGRRGVNTNLKVPDSFCMRELMFVEQLEPLHYPLGLVRVSGSR